MAQNRITCSGNCGKEKDATRDFYSSHSPFHKHTGRMHVCKACFLEYVNEDIDKLKQALRMIDRPFSTEILKSSQEEAESNGKSLVGMYMKNLGLRQNRTLTWDDSSFDGYENTRTLSLNSFNSEDKEELYQEAKDEINQISKEDLKYLISFWGKGFKVDEYILLQTEYEDWTNRYECDSKGMETLIQQICLTQLDISNRRSKEEKVDAQLKTLQDLLGSSNLKPVQETGANAIEQETFGTLIKKYENERPVPEAEEKWKDVDGISKYVRVFFKGHLARMLGIKNEDGDEEYWEEMNAHTVSQPVHEDEDDDQLL
jgi:hypothetical protein